MASSKTIVRESVRPLPFPTGPVLVVAILFALASVVGILNEITATSTSTPPNVSPADAFRDTRNLWEYIAILAMAVCGFRRLAAALALVGGILASMGLALLGLMSASGAPLLAAFAHLFAAVAGFAYLRSEKARREPSGLQMLLGSGFSLAVWGAVWLFVSADYAAKYQVVKVKQVQFQAAEATAERHADATAWATTTDNLRALAAVAFCIERSRGVPATRRYPRTLAEWRDLAGPSAKPPCHLLTSGARSSGDTIVADLSPHARVYYVPPHHGRGDPLLSRGFSLELEVISTPAEAPLPYDAPGAQNYLIDTSGSIHIAFDRRPTVRDLALPPCTAPNHPRYCLVYLPRQRWGVTAELPKATLTAASGTVLLGDTVAFVLRYTPVAAIDSLRSVDIDWGEPNDTTHIVVPRGTSYRGPRRPLVFSARHAFADSAPHVVRAAFLASDGAWYEALDTVDVRRRPRRVSSLGTLTDGTIVSGDVEAQTTRALANAREAMTRKGRRLDNDAERLARN